LFLGLLHEPLYYLFCFELATLGNPTPPLLCAVQGQQPVLSICIPAFLVLGPFHGISQPLECLPALGVAALVGVHQQTQSFVS
jgi:hypothetical protein